MEKIPTGYKWSSFENIYNSINVRPLIGNFTHKIDGSNISISITNNYGSKSIIALYGREKIIWEKPLESKSVDNDMYSIEDIPELTLYGNSCRINSVLKPGSDFVSILCDILEKDKKINIERFQVFFEIYKTKKSRYNNNDTEFTCETLHPFGYKINDEKNIMLNMDTSNYFNQVSKIMYGEGSVLSSGFSSFSDLHEYLRTLSENVVIVPKILFYGELIDGVIALGPQLINIPENLKYFFEGFFWVNDEVSSKISGLKFKSFQFLERKDPILIEESYSEKIINLIKIYNEIICPGSVEDIGNLFGDTCVSLTESIVSNLKNKPPHNKKFKKEIKEVDEETEIYNNVDSAILHELNNLIVDEFLVLENKLKYIFSLLCNTNNDCIAQDIKNQIDELINSIKTEFAKGYTDNDLEVPQIDIDHYIYNKLNEKYIELKKSLPKKKK